MVAPRESQPPEGNDDDHDHFGPPKTSVEVYCLHCRCVYMSDETRWEPDPDGPDGGWWMCPIEDCDGKGFCFDIFPTDPAIAKQFGVEYFDDPEEDDYDELDDIAEEDLINDIDPSPRLPPDPPPPGGFTDDDLPF